MTTLKTSTRTSTGRKKEKGKTPQQLEKNRKKGTRGNRLELDGDKTIAKNRKEWKDNNQNLPRIEGQRVSWASH
jgi:hypothetical protein